RDLQPVMLEIQSRRVVEPDVKALLTDPLCDGLGQSRKLGVVRADATHVVLLPVPVVHSRAPPAHDRARDSSAKAKMNRPRIQPVSRVRSPQRVRPQARYPATTRVQFLRCARHSPWREKPGIMP